MGVSVDYRAPMTVPESTFAEKAFNWIWDVHDPEIPIVPAARMLQEAPLNARVRSTNVPDRPIAAPHQFVDSWPMSPGVFSHRTPTQAVRSAHIALIGRKTLVLWSKI